MVESTQQASNPEEEHKNILKEVTKGMKQIDFKNEVVSLESKKTTWEEMKTPDEIIKGLNKMSYRKPSIIQGISIPLVNAEQNSNFLFQAINGCGKTGAFAVPSLMRVDPAV